MSKVYVIQNHCSYNNTTGRMEPRYDLSPAKKFGDLVFLLPPIKVPSDGEAIVSELRDRLQTFSDEDYLLLTGNPCFIGWATAIAADINDGRVKMLQWSGKHRKYYEVSALNL